MICVSKKTTFKHQRQKQLIEELFMTWKQRLGELRSISSMNRLKLEIHSLNFSFIQVNYFVVFLISPGISYPSISSAIRSSSEVPSSPNPSRAWKSASSMVSNVDSELSIKSGFFFVSL